MTLPLRQSPRTTRAASTAAERKSSVAGTTIQSASMLSEESRPTTGKNTRSRGRPKADVSSATELETPTTKTSRNTETNKAETSSKKRQRGAEAPDSVVSMAKSAVNGTNAKASVASRKRKAKEETQEEQQADAEPETPVSATAAKAKANVKAEKDDLEVKAVATPAKKSKAAKKAKTDDEPLASRTDVTQLKKAMYIGAHVSSAGGVQNSVSNAAHIGGNAFALFLKSQRKWQNPPLADDARDAFHAACAEAEFDASRHCLPHGSYLVNLAQAEEAKLDQAYTTFVDDLRRCDALGICLYNFHPGAVAGNGTRESALDRIAAALNRAHADTAPSKVVTVIENMAGQGTTVGDRFEDLAAIIAQIDDKTRVGVCIDTCHAFAAGYDLRTPESFNKVIAEFDRIVGLQYLRAVHLNDSKAPLASHRDLHANIGTGFLGLRAFHSLVNNDAFAGLPMVLETPIDRVGSDGKESENRQVWADEIKLLESLIGMDPESDEFKMKEKALQAEGAEERARLQEQVNKKSAKDVKKKR